MTASERNAAELRLQRPACAHLVAVRSSQCASSMWAIHDPGEGIQSLSSNKACRIAVRWLMLVGVLSLFLKVSSLLFGKWKCVF